MVMYPAIDLKNGQSVRLYQGDFDQETLIEATPFSQAQRIENAGLTHLHVVDLDGAVAGKPVNQAIIEQIVTQTQLKVEVGGGIRTLDQIAQYLEMGVDQVVLGSIAWQNPNLVQMAIERFGPAHLTVGLDGKGGKIAIQGWLDVVDKTFADLLSDMLALGVQRFVVTDIARDGTLTGPNLALLTSLQAQFPTAQLVASGGVSTVADIQALQAAGIADVIIGRALFDGAVTLPDLVKLEAENDIS